MSRSSKIYISKNCKVQLGDVESGEISSVGGVPSYLTRCRMLHVAYTKSILDELF